MFPEEKKIEHRNESHFHVTHKNGLLGFKVHR